MSGALQPAQPGAVMPSPFHLSDEALRALLVRFMTPYQWIKLAAVNEQCLRVVTAILQVPAPALFHIRDGSLKLMEVDLRTPVICGRSSLSAHVSSRSTFCPDLPPAQVRMQSTAPMQFLLEPTNPLNGVVYSEHGGTWKHTLTKSVTLDLSDRFSLDIQYPDLGRAIFQLGCLRPPNLAVLTAGTQPVDDFVADDVPDCLLDLLGDDIFTSILRLAASHLDPQTNLLVAVAGLRVSQGKAWSLPCVSTAVSAGGET